MAIPSVSIGCYPWVVGWIAYSRPSCKVIFIGSNPIFGIAGSPVPQLDYRAISIRRNEILYKNSTPLFVRVVGQKCLMHPDTSMLDCFV